MILGIVGSEAAKFEPKTKDKAKHYITELVKQSTKIVSGGCHLGGIDIWAVEIAKQLNVPYQEFLPKELKWNTGYAPRNLLIALNSDIVICITIREYPPNYNGMKFKFCYHCQTDTHIKSGGCWTVKKAIELGKVNSRVIVVD